MNTGRWSIWFRLASLVVVLAFAFGLTSPVRAEGEEPTAPPAPTEGAPEAGAPEAPAPLPDPVEAVAALDENNAVLLDESGQPVPLASEEAVVLLTAPDPWFTCPIALDTADGTADGICRYTAIQAAVDDFAAKSGSGMIFIEAGTFAENVEINGVAGLTGLKGNGSREKQADLADTTAVRGYILVKNMPSGFYVGGLDIIDSSPADNLRFENVGGTIMVEDVAVTETTGGTPGGAGIVVTDSTAAVDLKQVKVWEMPGAGAAIDNSNGSAGVSISNASFFDNDAEGMKIFTPGTLTLNGVSAVANNGDGAKLTAKKGFSIQNSAFDGNIGYGLILTDDSAGAATLKNLVANNNTFAGIVVGSLNARAPVVVTGDNLTASDNGRNPYSSFGGDIESGIFIRTVGAVNLKNITVNNNDKESSSTEFNRWDGLDVWSLGAITLANVTANANGGNGVSLFNPPFIGPTPTSPTPISVTNLVSDENGAHGLTITNRGTITLNGVKSRWNGWAGAYLDNSIGSAAVTLLATAGSNEFYWNEGYYDGKDPDDVDGEEAFYYSLEIYSKGAVTLNNTSANGNQSSGGAYIQTVGAVTIKGAGVYTSTFSGNYGDGLTIDTLGAINLSGFAANNNGGTGILLDVPENRNPLTLAGVEASYNGSNGLVVITQGAITLKGVSAIWNDSLGGLLDNRGPLNRGVTVADKKWSNFNGNAEGGLIIDTYGPVTLQNVSATENTLFHVWDADGSGAYGNTLLPFRTQTYNFSATAGDEIDINLVTSFSGQIKLCLDFWTCPLSASFGEGGGAYDDLVLPEDGDYELSIYASDWEGGYYTLTFSLNDGAPGAVIPLGGPGVKIDNSGGAIPAPVKVTNPVFNPMYWTPSTEFDGNGGIGLEITSRGPVSLIGVHAQYNNSGGVKVSTTSTATFQAKNLMASTNNGKGLNLKTGGGANIEVLEARHNAAEGLWIDAPGAVSVSGVKDRGYIDHNDTGVRIISMGAISLTNLSYGTYNTNYGILLDNPDSSAAVTLKNVNVGGENYGLWVRTKGAVSLTGVNVYESGIGADLDNSSDLKRAVTITNSRFNDAYSLGLRVRSSGPITLKNVGGYGNDAAGFVLDNALPGSTAAVNITGGSLSGDAYDMGIGLKVRSNGAINVTGMSVTGFWGNGMDLDNAASPLTTKPGVTVRSASINGLYGGIALQVITAGAILVDKSSTDNVINGLLLDNSAGAANITVQSSRFMGSGDYGIQPVTKGNILINGVTTEWFQTGLLVADHPGTLTINAGTFRWSGIAGANITMSGEGKALTVTRSVFNNNGTGLTALTKGPIVLNGVTASYNQEIGATLSNKAAAVPATVLVTSALGRNTFNQNRVGLNVHSASHINVTGFSADSNTEIGLWLDNCNGDVTCTTSGNITLRSGSASYNDDAGIHPDAGGTITVSGVTAIYNGRVVSMDLPKYGTGLFARSVGGVSISDSAFYANYYYGILSHKESGSLTLSGVFYYGNWRSGDNSQSNIFSN